MPYVSVGIGLDHSQLAASIRRANDQIARGVADATIPAGVRANAASAAPSAAPAVAAGTVAAGAGLAAAAAAFGQRLRIETRAVGETIFAAFRATRAITERMARDLHSVASDSGVGFGRQRQADIEEYSRALVDRQKRLNWTIATTGSAARRAYARVGSAILGARRRIADLTVSQIRFTREVLILRSELASLASRIVLPFRLAVRAVGWAIDRTRTYSRVVAGVGRSLGGVATAAAPGFAAASTAIGSAASTAAGAVSALGAASAIAGAAAAAGLAVAVRRASDFNETVNKSREVFGSSAAVVAASADEMARAYGVPKQTFVEAASRLGLVAKAGGYAESAAADLGVSFAKLAADMSSFYNVPIERALDAINSGLVGESKPMRAFGVLLDEAQVKAEAFRLGLARQGEELTNVAKVQARASLMTRGLADATGDLARTADEPANLMRKMRGNVDNLSVAIGGSLLGAFRSLLRLIDEFAGGSEAGFDRVVAAFGAMGDAIRDGIDSIAVVYRNWSDYGEIAAENVSTRLLNVGEAFGWVGSAASAAAAWLAENWRTVIPDALEAVQTAVANVGRNIARIWGEIWDWIRSKRADPIEISLVPVMEGAKFRSAKLELPPLELSRPDESRINAAMDRIAARESERAKRASDGVRRGVAGPEELGDLAPDAAPADARSGGQTMDLTAFRDAIQRSLFESDDKALEVARQNLEEQRRANANLSAIARNTARAGGYA